MDKCGNNKSGEGARNGNEGTTNKSQILTHFSFIFERIIATIPNAMEMRGPLAGKAAKVGIAFFSRAETLKTARRHRQTKLKIRLCRLACATLTLLA